MRFWKEKTAQIVMKLVQRTGVTETQLSYRNMEVVYQDH